MKAAKDLGAQIEKLFQISGDPTLHSSDKGVYLSDYMCLQIDNQKSFFFLRHENSALEWTGKGKKRKNIDVRVFMMEYF